MLWTANLVEERFEEATDTLRRLPSVKVQGYFSLWPAIRQETQHADIDKTRIRLGPPRAAAISRMDETLTWLRWLTPEERLLVWLRAENTGWKQICWKMGCSRTTAWRNWVFALQKIALMLNETKVPVCTATQKGQPNA